MFRNPFDGVPFEEWGLPIVATRERAIMIVVVHVVSAQGIEELLKRMLYPGRHQYNAQSATFMLTHANA